MKLSLLCLCAVFAGAAIQDRAKKLTAADLPKVLQSASKNLEAKRYGACQRDLKTALGLVANLVRDQLLATMPPAPPGFQVVAREKGDDSDAAVAHAMGVTLMQCEQKYRNETSHEEIEVTILPDTPMASMMTMAFNMAAMSKEGELITYKDHKGLLKKSGDRYELQILVAGKHLIQVQAGGIDDEGLLKMIDQAFVDRVAAAIDG